MLLLQPLLGRIYVNTDLGAGQFPYRLLYSRCLQGGESWIWCPWTYCGRDVQAERNYYHPLSFVLFRYLPLPAAYAVNLVVAYPVMFAGTYWLFRRWSFPRDAAASAAR